MTNTQFKNKLVKYMKDNNLSDEDLRHRLNISKPTLKRWLEGRNIPHQAMHKAIFTIQEKHSNIKDLQTQ